MNSRHFALVDAVNDATTQEDRDRAYWHLNGYRDGVEDCGCRWSGIDADMHTMQRFGDERPMCCGVLLDWKPA